jgi:hypothetical protein
MVRRADESAQALKGKSYLLFHDHFGRDVLRRKE